MDRPLRVAVVGAGPSGLYSADALLSQDEVAVMVDVIDRLPTPFGLVRYGVAPDHLSIRSVREKLDGIFDNPGIRFLGNVEVGKDLTWEQMEQFYDAVILAYGASRDRELGIPGEDLPGSIAATDLVNWYTGHPDMPPDAFTGLLAGSRSVAVIGVGNVAVDVTRVLSKSPEEIEHTDMPEHVFAALRASGVREIHLIGRRGPAQANWTTKELRELGELADCGIVVDEGAQVDDPASVAAIASDKATARNVAVIEEWLARPAQERPRMIHVHFRSRPVEIRGTGRVEEIVVERTTLDDEGRASGTGDLHTIAVDVVVRSVGYRGLPLDDLPFDGDRHVIPNVDGRVVNGSDVMRGLYVTGWIKRGPSGIIGTNKKCAVQTVSAVLADASEGLLERATDPDPEAVMLALADVDVVDHAGWRRIDAAERSLGEQAGRARTTLHDRSDLIAASR